MAVQPIKKVRSVAEIEAQFKRNVADMNSAVLKNLASTAIGLSPVDTGTYITSHAIYEGDNLGSIPTLYSSLARPGGQDYSQFAGTGLAKLTAMIDMLDHSSGNYIFGNESEHRWDVEVPLAYRVFSGTRAAFPEAVQAAKASTGLK